MDHIVSWYGAICVRTRPSPVHIWDLHTNTALLGYWVNPLLAYYVT